MHRYAFVLVAATGLAALAGCNGPTKAGTEARAAARERLGEFKAGFVLDQARQEFEAGRLERAVETVRQALVALPEDPKAHLLMGRVQFEQGRLEQSLASFEKAIEFDEGFADAHYRRGIVLQRWRRDVEAYESYVKAAELEPSNVHYLLAAAETLVMQRRLDEAEALVDEKLPIFEYNAALRQLSAQIAALEGDRAKAAQLLDEARMLRPDDDQLLEEVVIARWRAGMHGACLEAITLLQGRLDEPRFDLVLLEARCLALVGRGEEAHAAYRTLLRLRPDDVRTWIEFGSVAWDLEDWRRLAWCGGRLTDLAPDRFEGHLFKGLYERWRGELDLARGHFEDAAERAPDAAIPHLLLGRTLAELGRTDDAKAAYRDALKADPGNAEAQVLLSRLAGTDAAGSS